MRAISTKYHGPTQHRGARVIADDGEGNKVSVPASMENDAHEAAARALCAKMGWTGTLARGETKTGSVFVWIERPHCLLRIDRDKKQPWPKTANGGA